MQCSRRPPKTALLGRERLSLVLCSPPAKAAGDANATLGVARRRSSTRSGPCCGARAASAAQAGHCERQAADGSFDAARARVRGLADRVARAGRGGVETIILSLCRLALETAGARRCCQSAAPAAGAQAGGWHGDLHHVDACDADFAHGESLRPPSEQDQRSRALFHGRYLEFRIALPCPHRCARQAKADGCGGAIRAARASAGRR